MVEIVEGERNWRGCIEAPKVMFDDKERATAAYTPVVMGHQ